MPSRQPRTRTLAIAALVAVGLFPVIVLALNLVQQPDGYSAGRDAVSELALGRDGAVMAAAFCSLGVGTLLFAALLRQTSTGAAVRTTLLSIAGVLSFVSAAFHTDRAGAPATAHGHIHDAAGIATFVAMLVTMAISAWRFRREPAWAGFAVPTATLTVAGVVAFFLVPTLGQAHFGLSQRLLIGAFIAWMLTGTIHCLRTTASDVAPAPAVPSVELS
jgi:hypothetical protein